MLYLGKRQSLIIAMTILAIFFAVVYGVVRNNNQSSLPQPQPSPSPAHQNNAQTAPMPQSTIVESPQEDLGTPQFSLRNFNRSEMRGGKKSWEIKAALGEYFPDKQILRLSESKLHLYRPNGDTVTLNSHRALVKMQGTTLLSATLDGDVVAVYNDKVTARTEHAIYDQQKNRLNAPGHVQISGEFFDVSGDGLTVDTLAKSSIIERNVTTVIKRGIHGLPRPH